jgi:nodal
MIKRIVLQAIILSLIILIWYFEKVLLIDSSNEVSIDHTKPPENTLYYEMSSNNYYNHTLAKRSVSRRRILRKKIYTQNSNCKKLDFNVNFGELGWEKWIIYPKIFNAYFCSGGCMLPFKKNSSSNKVISTNHAQIMSILELKNPNLNIQMTKCVSTKLKPLTVVFLDGNGLIKTKIYQDMVVEECGCR